MTVSALCSLLAPPPAHLKAHCGLPWAVFFLCRMGPTAPSPMFVTTTQALPPHPTRDVWSQLLGSETGL